MKEKELGNKIKIMLATAVDVRGMTEVYYKTWRATYPDETIGVTVEDIDFMYKDVFSEEEQTRRRNEISHPKEGNTQLVAKIGDMVVGLCWVSKKPEKNQL